MRCSRSGGSTEGVCKEVAPVKESPLVVASVMDAFPHVENPPIVEALIDLRVQARDGLKVEELTSLRGRLATDYPKVKDIHQLQAEIAFEASLGTVASKQAHGRTGLRFEKEDGTYVFQAQVGGFTLSRVRDYEDFPSLKRHAQALWSTYCAVTSPASVSRVAVRYINRLELPAPIGDITEYLRCNPPIPESAPKTVTEFLSRVVMEDESGASVNFVQATDNASAPMAKVAVIIDIDVFKAVSLNPSDAAIWDLLDHFRILKNRVFFGSVTERALEVLDEHRSHTS
jgi:uncharacterized protein (TIGR04255 family)